MLALVLAALGLLARTAVDGWPAFARTVCQSVTTGVCPPAVYRSAAYELGLAGVAFAVTRSLAAIAPFVTLFARGTGEVARLAEMRADDAAARRAGGQGRRTLLTALLAMGAGVAAPASPGPASWLPATGGVVAARVRRLAEPVPPAAWRVTG